MRKGFLAFLTAGLLGLSMMSSVSASIQDEIAYAQMQKAQAEASISAVQSSIYSLETKKQELETYLAELNTQYQTLADELLVIEANTIAKEEELVQVKADLKAAQIEKQNQYEAMKIRIAYMFEQGESNALIVLLSSSSFADFLNSAENIMALTQYDRDMLTKYEETCDQVALKEETVNYEIEELGVMMAEKEAKQQEVEDMVESTNANIQSYISQISASQEEISYWMAEAYRADSSISALYARAEAEANARAQAKAQAQQHSSHSSYDYDSDYSGEDYDDYNDYDDYSDYNDYSESDSWNDYDDYYEDDYYEDSYDDYYEDDYSDYSSSSSGTYLGTFKLTGYCSCASCCGTANNPTASGVYPSAGHTVAMAGVPFGTQLLINGCVYTVEDLGTPYGHVDIYFSSHQSALNFGLQYAEVYRLN